MPSVDGILETALYVSDLPRAAEFYKRIFNFPSLFESTRLLAFDVAKRDVLLLFSAEETSLPLAVPGGIIPPHGPGGASHFAFSIAAMDVDSWQRHLEASRVEIESVVRWPQGAISIYFRDPDQNLVELITPGFWANY